MPAPELTAVANGFAEFAGRSAWVTVEGLRDWEGAAVAEADGIAAVCACMLGPSMVRKAVETTRRRFRNVRILATRDFLLILPRAERAAIIEGVFRNSHVD
jgi:hypothetical protein